MADRPPIVVTYTIDPDVATARGRKGAAVTNARYDGRAITAAARRAFADKFAREADPAGVLPAEELERLAAGLRSAHFRRLAALSAAAHRRRAAERDGGAR